MINDIITPQDRLVERQPRHTGAALFEPEQEGFTLIGIGCTMQDARGLEVAAFRFDYQKREFDWWFSRPIETVQAEALFTQALNIEREAAARDMSVQLLKARNAFPSPAPSPPLPGRIQMAKLAGTARKRAELTAELAQIDVQQARVFQELADGTAVDLRTGKRLPRVHVPKLSVPNDRDRAAAREALRLRRRPS